MATMVVVAMIAVVAMVVVAMVAVVAVATVFFCTHALHRRLVLCLTSRGAPRRHAAAW